MATSRLPSSDLRRQLGSPRPRGRENKETLCRNVLIYGHCRYEDQGCTFSHNLNKNAGSATPDMPKKILSVDSPSFTPSSVQPVLASKPSFTSQAANAPTFTPRGLGARTPSASQSTSTSEGSVFNPGAIREFTPTFEANPAGGTNGSVPEPSAPFDIFNMTAVGTNLPATPFNPYADEQAGLSAPSASFFPPSTSFAAPPPPLQHHLYAPAGPRRHDLMPYHRLTRDFFLPEELREELQRKSEAAQQIMPNSQLPQLDHYHSLVALDTTHRKNANIFGYPSWVYKANSSKTGALYCLRRLEGFRLTNEHAIRSVKEWKKVYSANVVTVYDAFTVRAFGDSSLIFVQDYYPLSKTLAELHLPATSSTPATSSRAQQKGLVPETLLWAYISQIANALRAIHSVNLAARCVDASKIIVTDKNHIRLNACSILDVVQYKSRRPLQELQQEDFLHFGRTILSLATNTLPAQLTNLNASVEQFSRNYSAELRDTVVWLLTPPQPPASKTIDDFVRGIAIHVVQALDQSMLHADEVTSHLCRELENSRAARLMMKLATINERFEFDGDPLWSENGERYLLKLFRDYVFHQVDSKGNPVLDIGHMLRCMNKLDAGTDEQICLTSRDNQSIFVVSYKELKKFLANAFGDLQKGNKQSPAF